MTLISGTQTYTYTVGQFINGIWVEDPEEAGTFEGSIQPLNYKDVQSLPVGRQDTGMVKVYSDIPLPVGEEVEDINVKRPSGAILDWQGKKWEVKKEKAYQMGLILHYRYEAELRP